MHGNFYVKDKVRHLCKLCSKDLHYTWDHLERHLRHHRDTLSSVDEYIERHLVIPAMDYDATDLDNDEVKEDCDEDDQSTRASDYVNITKKIEIKAHDDVNKTKNIERKVPDIDDKIKNIEKRSPDTAIPSKVILSNTTITPAKVRFAIMYTKHCRIGVKIGQKYYSVAEDGPQREGGGTELNLISISCLKTHCSSLREG